MTEKVGLTQRGNRNRARGINARLQNIFDRMGLDAFKAEVESRLGYSLAPARPYTFIRNVDNGGHHVMLFLKNGRIQDEPQRDFNPGLREIDMIFKGTFQRYLPVVIEKVEKISEENGLRYDSFVMPITACPNGCARPYVAEVAFVGKAPRSYSLVHRNLTFAPFLNSRSSDMRSSDSRANFVIRAGYTIRLCDRLLQHLVSSQKTEPAALSSTYRCERLTSTCF